MEKHMIQIILEEEGLSVRRYSGRGMYGKYCVGVEAKLGDVVAALVSTAGDQYEEDVEDIAELCRNIQTDTLGMGMITYFPDVQFVADEDDDGEQYVE